MNAKIYKCAFGFKYTSQYVSIILIADDYNDAKNKFISKCLEKYDVIIRSIDFKLFYYEEEADGPPVKFENISDFEKYLFENIDSDTIECLEECKFEIKDRYEN